MWPGSPRAGLCLIPWVISYVIIIILRCADRWHFLIHFPPRPPVSEVTGTRSTPSAATLGGGRGTPAGRGLWGGITPVPWLLSRHRLSPYLTPCRPAAPSPGLSRAGSAQRLPWAGMMSNHLQRMNISCTSTTKSGNDTGAGGWYSHNWTSPPGGRSLDCGVPAPQSNRSRCRRCPPWSS